MAESNLAKLATVGVSCFALGVMVSLVAGRLLGSDTLPEDDMSFEDLPEEVGLAAVVCSTTHLDPLYMITCMVNHMLRCLCRKIQKRHRAHPWATVS